MPHYDISNEEQEAYIYCVSNDIIISPFGDNRNPSRWYVGISYNGKYKQVHKSPETYGRDEIWEVVFNYCKFYYDKRSKR